MTTQISTFNFKSFPVRIHILGSEPFFCLLDVASVLGLCNRSVSKFKFNPQGVEKLSTPTTSGDQEMIFINEPNLYRVIFRSNKPEAETFQNWVFEEVLPQIRKTGQYSQNNQPNLPLASPAAEEETMHIIVNLFHCLNEAYELGRKLCDEHPHLARELNKQVGGHYLHNLHHPTRNALDKAKRYIQAESERIMFIKGMIALFETPKPKAVSQF